MKTAIYNKVKRVAMLALLSSMFAPTIQAQEALHLFYKGGGHKKIDITEDLKVEFVKHPFLEVTYLGAEENVLHISANAGRTFNYGYVNANVPFTASVDAPWLTVRYDKENKYKYPIGEGALETNFLIFSEANKTGEERTATITFTPKRGEAKTLTVVQRPAMLSLEQIGQDYGFEATVSKEEIIAWDDTVYYAYAYPNFGVKVLSKPNWMRLDTIACGGENFSLEDVGKVPDNIRVTHENLGFSNTVARFYFDKNLTTRSRSGNIIFEGNGETAVLTVTQEGLNETTIMRESQALYLMLYTFGGAIGESHHNDFGVPSMMLFTDTRGMDLVSDDIGYNWFGAALSYTDMGADKVPTYIYWRTLYYNIKAINRSINAFQSIEVNPYIRSYLAQAYALRAFDYFYLAQMYEHTYVGNEDAPCVPIVTEENMEQEYTEGIPCASVREVYDYILQNLDEAIALLESNTVPYPDKEHISLEAAYGLRARINLVMNRWQEAAADAQRVIDAGVAYPYSMDEVSRPTFTDINDHAWLWGIDTEETDRAVTSGICNWPSHMGSLNYGYASVGAWRKVNKSLYNAIPETDVRKGWFLNENAYSPNLNDEQAAYATSAGCPPYCQMKFGCYKDEIYTSTNANDIPLMRIEEMYLILAEAKAMLGDVAMGAQILNNFVRSYRDPAYYCGATTTEDLVEAVWMQRRIELWGEGHSYFDLMRMKKGVDRRGAGFRPNYVFNIPAGDAALIYPIPDGEMNSNPQLLQNPAAEAPVAVEDVNP